MVLTIIEAYEDVETAGVSVYGTAEPLTCREERAVIYLSGADGTPKGDLLFMTDEASKPERSGDGSGIDTEQLTEKLFFDATRRINSYLRFRYLWIPGVAIALFLVLAYFGASNWISYRVQQEIESTIDSKLENGRLRIDSLIRETERSVARNTESVRLYNDQMNILLRSYELLLPYLATDLKVLDTTGHVVAAFVKAYSQLGAHEFFKLTLSRIGTTTQFSVKVVNVDSLYMAIAIPSQLVRDNFRALQALGFMTGFSAPEGHPSLELRAESYFRDPTKAASDIDKIANVLFGIDKVVMSKFEFFAKPNQ